VFGDGSQVRDFVYVDDAVEAFLAAGASDAVNGEAFNVGGDEHIAHRDLVALLVALAGQGHFKFIEWPIEKKAIDIGSFYADSSLFKSRTGWTPAVALSEGFTRTLRYYRAHLPHYVEPRSV
jgi:UDP-glucose 4-epimerase